MRRGPRPCRRLANGPWLGSVVSALLVCCMGHTGGLWANHAECSGNNPACMSAAGPSTR